MKEVKFKTNSDFQHSSQFTWTISDHWQRNIFPCFFSFSFQHTVTESKFWVNRKSVGKKIRIIKFRLSFWFCYVSKPYFTALIVSGAFKKTWFRHFQNNFYDVIGLTTYGMRIFNFPCFRALSLSNFLFTRNHTHGNSKLPDWADRDRQPP